MSKSALYKAWIKGIDRLLEGAVESMLSTAGGAEREFEFPHLLATPNGKILEVGGGPAMNSFGSRHQGNKLQYFSCDPFAPCYKRISKYLHYTPPRKYTFALPEQLTKACERGEYSLVLMKNALDQCLDPLLAIRQMLEIVHVGGKIVLVHQENRGISEQYKGICQYNITANEENELLIWNEIGTLCINTLLQDVATISIERCDYTVLHSPVMKAILTKTAPDSHQQPFFSDHIESVNELNTVMLHYILKTKTERLIKKLAAKGLSSPPEPAKPDPVKSSSYRARYLQLHPAHFDDVYSDVEEYSKEYDIEISQFSGLQVKNFSLYNNDFSSKYIHVENGIRETCFLPQKFKNTIYVLGASYVYGSRVADEHTICSFLQHRLNEVSPGMWRVQNHGIPGVRYPNCWLQILSLDLQPGDVVILIDKGLDQGFNFIEYVKGLRQYCAQKDCRFLNFLYPRIKEIKNPSILEQKLASYSYKELYLAHKNEIDLPPVKKQFSLDPERVKNIKKLKKYSWFHDLQNDFSRPHPYGEVFRDRTHLCIRGNRLIADILCKKLVDPTAFAPQSPVFDNNFKALTEQSVIYLQDVVKRYMSKNSSIVQWLKTVPRFPDDVGTVGAIVMNCNPFTNGHLHCIQQALSRVSALYIFVVEENKSFFPFSDRLALVKRGTEYFGNRIIVMPSGKFIISSFSFPTYFFKETVAEAVDSSADTAIFGAIIAPELRITRRFVGEEPLCQVTRSYNAGMQRLLPPMGVEVEVFPRLHKGDAPISASRVRALLQKGLLEQISSLVPHTTYNYILQWAKVHSAIIQPHDEAQQDIPSVDTLSSPREDVDEDSLHEFSVVYRS